MQILIFHNAHSWILILFVLFRGWYSILRCGFLPFIAVLSIHLYSTGAAAGAVVPHLQRFSINLRSSVFITHRSRLFEAARYTAILLFCPCFTASSPPPLALLEIFIPILLTASYSSPTALKQVPCYFLSFIKYPTAVEWPDNLDQRLCGQCESPICLFCASFNLQSRKFSAGQQMSAMSAELFICSLIQARSFLCSLSDED